MNTKEISKIGKVAEKFVTDNSPTILTVVGVVGTVGTAYLTAKASFKASKKIADKEFVVKTHPTTPYSPEKDVLTKTEIVKLVWMDYIPPVVAGTGTVAAIVLANRISAKRMAALAAGYGLLDNRFEEYKEKMREKLGVKKERDARDEIAQDRTNKNPPDTTVIITEGKSLFKDEPTGRYFESTMEDVKRAENDLNRKIIKDEYAVLTDWYDMIGLPPTSLSEEFGWVITGDPIEIIKSAVITQEGRPCICLDYEVRPIRNGYVGNAGSGRMSGT